MSTGARVWVRWVALSVALAAGVAAPSRARAEPQWVTDLKAKAKAHEQRLKDALDRLKRAAAEAAAKLDAVAKARLAELTELLEGQLRAAQRVLADAADEYAAVVDARLGEAAAVAEQLAREVGEVIAGTRRQIEADGARLVTGAGQIVGAALRDAGVMLGEARIVDDRVVADAIRATEEQARRWLGLVGAGGGVVAIALGAGLIWQRRRRPAARWLLTAGGAVVIAGGVVAAVLGIRYWRARPTAAPVMVGLVRCDALAGAQRLIDAGRAPPADRAPALAALERCQLLVADGAVATLIDDRLRKLRRLPE